jgi:hypothetical protein
MTTPVAAMNADPAVLERIVDRLARTLTAGGPEHARAPFTVSEIVHALVPYRTYRHELGVDTLQDYEHAVLELLAGAHGWLICDADTVDRIRLTLASPDPDTSLLRDLERIEVRLGVLPVRAPAPEPAPAPAAVSEPVPAAAAVAVEAPDERSADAAVPAEGHAGQRESAPVEPAAAAVEAPLTLPPLHDLTALVSPPAPPAPATTPLQSLPGVTLAPTATLARITPLSVPSVYGDPIDFRGVRHAPVDVGGVIFLFGMVARELGFTVEAMLSGFPRCEAKRQLAPGKWARVRIEFELESRHFRDAGRSPSACDLLVCWRDTWPDRPSSLEVLSLERVLPTLTMRSAV